MIEPLIELAARESGTLLITLLWNRRSCAVSVLVEESATGESFEFPVADHDALEAYYHPYAYAALGRRDEAASAGKGTVPAGQSPSSSA